MDSTDKGLPSGYSDWLADVKERVRQARLRASLAVHGELILLYWEIGRDILERQTRAGWGAKVVDRLAYDLRREFPEMRGFSPRNLKYMRAFAEAWPDRAFVQAALAPLPWYHHLALLEKLATPDERVWYLQQAVEHGWSRNVLVHQIETRLRERQGRALTNFPRTLPAPQSDLAQQLLKDPYQFDFLALGAAVLPDQLARPPLRHPEHPLQVLDRAAPAGRAHQFPRPSSFKASIWSSLSATIRFNLAFSVSSSFRRLTSSAFSPPYWARQRW